MSGKISNEKDRYAYIKSMRECNAHILSSSNLDTALIHLKKMKSEYPNRFLRRFEIFSNVKKYYMCGIDHSIDIVASIKARFETGSSSSDDVFVRTLLGGKYED